MDEKTFKPLVIIAFIAAMLIPIVGISTAVTKEYKNIDEYNKNYRKEDEEIFGSSNEDYKDMTAKDSKEIILEFDEKYSKEANLAIMNYISNVNGKLKEVNGKTVVKNTLSPVVGGVYNTNGLGIGTGVASSVKGENKNIYLILVPKDAKFSDKLQERLDRYIKYKDNSIDGKI